MSNVIKPIKASNTFRKLQDELRECMSETDIERAHVKADEILIQVALDSTLNIPQRQKLVDMYNAVEKCYA